MSLISNPAVALLVRRGIDFSRVSTGGSNPAVVFDEEPKTGLGFETGQRQQTSQRRPTLQT